MTDHETKLLKWVAEVLLGLKPGKYAAPGYLLWHDKSGQGYFESDLQSWEGIGLVVEEMGKREDTQQIIKFNTYLQECPSSVWWMLPAPWNFVYEAARRAVTND